MSAGASRAKRREARGEKEAGGGGIFISWGVVS
jgi:hypothetical protein